MRRSMIVLLLLSLLAACGTQQPGASQPTGAPQPSAASAASPAPAQPTAASAGARTLTVMTHDSFSVSEDVLKGFEKQENATVQVLKSGDAGAALNKAALSKNSPLADVFFGVDNTFLSRALKAGIFTVPGDPEGMLDLKPVLDKLAARNFKGWMCVEAEQDPAKANPLKYFKMARAYLAETAGL